MESVFYRREIRTHAKHNETKHARRPKWTEALTSQETYSDKQKTKLCIEWPSYGTKYTRKHNKTSSDILNKLEFDFFTNLCPCKTAIKKAKYITLYFLFTFKWFASILRFIKTAGEKLVIFSQCYLPPCFNNKLIQIVSKVC